MKRTINEKLIYSPQLSAVSSDAIRRYAFSKNQKMTKALNQLILALPAITDPSKICLSCKDKSGCKSCIFGRSITAEEKAVILAAL